MRVLNKWLISLYIFIYVCIKVILHAIKFNIDLNKNTAQFPHMFKPLERVYAL